ncbi:MAG: hypothetical protein JXR29_02335, partial [Methylothermaceae bacterium]|nr:hypothetical protein [Methylothermaceae bacterium]
MTRIDVHWVLAWIQSMKREDRLAPGTIRKKVGALARCLDWCVLAELAPSNPFRQLPKKYASYTSHDGESRADVERDRRLEPGEEDAIRRVLSLEKPPGRERPIDGKWIAAWECLLRIPLKMTAYSGERDRCAHCCIAGDVFLP